MIYEIRNYHFRPDLIDAHKAWAKAEAIPHLASQLAFELIQNPSTSQRLEGSSAFSD